ncbi:MAG: hypothetical protein ACXWVD_14810, partial [Telluria sp.]
CFSAPKSTSRRIENDNKRKRKWLLLRGACSERPVKKIIPDSSAHARERRGGGAAHSTITGDSA